MIGILTFSTNTNYGSWLLSYALYKKIRDLGYEAELIRFFYPECDQCERFSMLYIKEMINNSIDIANTFKNLKNRFGRQRKFEKAYREFIDRCYSVRRNNIWDLNKRYDKYVVGSDTVWDHRYCGNSYTFFLDFADDLKKKVSFSASMGYKYIPQDREKQIATYLRRFDRITVREETTKDLLQGIDIPSSLVCDPTMLILPEEWKKIMSKRMEEEKYILLYMASDYFLKKQAVNYAKQNGFKIIEISDTDPMLKEAKIINDISPLDWLSYIYYAEKVYTGSYHGILYSLYFNKQLCYVRRKPVNRMQNLEERLGIDCFELREERRKAYEIDWERINCKMRMFREESLQKLVEMLDL